MPHICTAPTSWLSHTLLFIPVLLYSAVYGTTEQRVKVVSFGICKHVVRYNFVHPYVPDMRQNSFIISPDVVAQMLHISFTICCKNVKKKL